MVGTLIHYCIANLAEMHNYCSGHILAMQAGEELSNDRCGSEVCFEKFMKIFESFSI